MDIPEPNKDNFLEEILKSYFNKLEILEFRNNLIRIEDHIPEDSRISIETDLLITFAEAKFDLNKFLEFLLSLGQIAVSAGEFSLAIDINEKLLAETKNKKQYLGISAGAYLSLGELYSRKSQWQLGFNNIKKANKLFAKQNDFYGLAQCENKIGIIYSEIGDYKKAKKHFEMSLSLNENKTDISLTGTIEINLGKINNIQGNYELALTYYQRALLNFQRLSNFKRVAEIKHDLGMTYLNLNKFETAINNFDESINTSLQSGSYKTLGITYISKAYLYALKEDFSLAEAFGDKAMEICYKINDKLSIAEIYKVKGIIQRSKQNFATSENYLLTSLRINTELRNKLNFAGTSFELGLLYKNHGNKKASKPYFDNAAKYFKSIDAQPDLKVIVEKQEA